jgi:ABC-type multidrug transport system fused ATPase/permease subunit
MFLILKKIKQLKFIFKHNEIKLLGFIILIVLLCTILDILSFATIIPVFNVVFFGEKTFFNFYYLPNISLDTKFKILILISFISLFVIKNIFIILSNFFFINYLKRIIVRISNNLFSSFTRQEYSLFLKDSSSNFLQKLTSDINNLNTFLVSLINFVTEIIFIIGISILLFITNYKIFIFSFSLFFSVVAIYAFFFKSRIAIWAKNYREYTGQTQEIIQQGIRGFKDIIIYKLEENFVSTFNSANTAANNSIARINFLNNVQRYWLEIIGVLGLSLALLYFVFVSADIKKLIPIFGLFVIVLFRLLSSFSRIIMHGQNLRFYYPSFDAILNECEKFSNSNLINEHKENIFNKSINIQNVSFFYSNSANKTLANINLNIQKGDAICFTGKNGSGKTTLLNLIAGFFKPTEGKILIDDFIELFSANKNWMKNLSYVQQNIFLLNDTIKKNIILVDENEIDLIKFDKVSEVLKLDKYFDNLSEKLQTKVGMDGIFLSGGQKQMISLARALYKDTDIMLFDEPSSALDANTKFDIKKIILNLKRKKTLIMVSHDIDYFSECFDKIIEINDSKLKIIK